VSRRRVLKGVPLEQLADGASSRGSDRESSALTAATTVEEFFTVCLEGMGDGSGDLRDSADRGLLAEGFIFTFRISAGARRVGNNSRAESTSLWVLLHNPAPSAPSAKAKPPIGPPAGPFPPSRSSALEPTRQRHCHELLVLPRRP